MQLSKYPGKSVFIGGYDITSIDGVFVQTVDIHQMPKRLMESYKLARNPGQKLVSAYFDTKEIIVKGSIVTGSEYDYDYVRDNLLLTVADFSTTLETTVNGRQRIYNVTLSEHTIPEHYGGYASFEIKFIAYDPFGYDTVSSIMPLQSITAANGSLAVTIEGSVEALPVISATLSAISGATVTRTVTIGNLSTGLAVSISRIWFTGDVLLVDTMNKSVTVNNVIVPWSGVLFSLEPGNNIVSYSDNFTTRTVKLTGTYVKRYL